MSGWAGYARRGAPHRSYNEEELARGHRNRGGFLSRLKSPEWKVSVGGWDMRVRIASFVLAAVALLTPGPPVDGLPSGVSGTPAAIASVPAPPESLFAVLTGPVFPTLDPPSRVAAADFDGDGRPDVAVVSRAAGTLTLYRQVNGDGAVVAHVATAGQPDRLLVADVDGDGKPDIIVASSASGAVGYFKGVGASGLAPRQDYLLPAPLTALALLDANGDGRLDLIGASSGRAEGRIVFLAGAAEAGFDPAPHTLRSFGALALATVDVNGDGGIDLVAGQEDSCCGAYALLTFLAAPEGLAQPPLVTSVAYRPELLIPGDFDRDGKLDVFVGPCGMGYYGAGDGNFQEKYYTLCTDWVEAAPVGPNSAVVSRVARDPGLLETGNSNGYYFLRNDLPIRLPEPVDGVAGTDWDGNGQVDYVVVSESRSLLRVVLADPNRSMNGALLLHLCLGLALVPGDLDGDGHADVVDIERTGSCGRDAHHISVYTYHCDEGGFLQRGSDPPFIANAQGTAAQGVLGDLAGNGALDLLFAAQGDVFRFDDVGHGARARATRQAFPADIERIAPADFNGDGHMDLAVLEELPRQVRIYRQVAGGAFQGDAPLVTRPGLRGLITGDCNDDGLVDVVVSDSLTNAVTIYAGQTDGSLRELASAGAGTQPVAAALTDFDLDGVPEIAVAARGSAEVVLLRLVDGTRLEVVGSLAESDPPVDVTTGDVTGDGHPDLLVAHRTQPVTLRVWQAGGTFSAPVSIPQSQGSDAGLGDLNRDGRADLLLSPGVAYLNVGGGPTPLSPDLLTAGVIPEAGGRRIEWKVRGYATGDRFRLFRVNGAGESALVVPRYFSGATRYAVVDSAAEAAASRYQLEMWSAEGVLARVDLPVPVGVAPLVSRLTATRTGAVVYVQWGLAQNDPGVRFQVYRQAADGAREMLGAAISCPGIECEFADTAPLATAAAYWLRYFTSEGRVVWWGPATVRAEGLPEIAALRVISATPSTGPVRLRYDLPADGVVSLRVFDARGRLVSRLREGMEFAGSREVLWDEIGASGTAIPSGVYFVRFASGATSIVRRIVRIR